MFRVEGLGLGFRVVGLRVEGVPMRYESSWPLAHCTFAHLPSRK